jgi:hypothetical protein
MKFALAELKITLVKLIMNFEILPGENMPNELELIEGIIRKPKNGVLVRLKKRDIISF